ncbi:LuxR C-terminal-related transcriptional regulator [Luteipulveratus mongoliensis]|uniref:LuxR C-terminal-related transcriptional regulator n=1 Tax=Luteipulveratus mongoliensis TaxID=571913 RepID=UPI00147077C5|nr:LuxR C-terminal-related transcriptional regulator [Luteipulveratus mongoliensis]
MSYIVTADRVVVQNVVTLIDRIVASSMPVQLRDRRRPLKPTLRQLRILHLMTYGMTDEKIASELKITSRTIRSAVADLYTMFEVQSRFELGIAYQRWVNGH